MTERKPFEKKNSLGATEKISVKNENLRLLITGGRLKVRFHRLVAKQMNAKGPEWLSCDRKLFLRLEWSRAGLLLLTDEVSSAKPPLSFRASPHDERRLAEPQFEESPAGEVTRRLPTHGRYLHRQRSAEAQPESRGRCSIHGLQAEGSGRHGLLGDRGYRRPDRGCRRTWRNV